MENNDQLRPAQRSIAIKIENKKRNPSRHSFLRLALYHQPSRIQIPTPKRLYLLKINSIPLQQCL